MKEKKAIESRYKDSEKIKEESDQRQSIKDFLILQIHEAISQLRTIEEEISIINYKDSIQKDPEAKSRHE
jgi:immunoglobulin-binding protein 1